MGNKHHTEGPVHQVTIAYHFFMEKYPTTVGIFKKFVQATNYKTEAEQEGGAYIWTGNQWEKKADAHWQNPYFPQTDEHPVVCVSWNDAKVYIEWLNAQTETKFRLPSEAEWEYVCRAGTTTRFSFGNDDEDLQDYGWFNGNSDYKTHPVGEKKPNPYGLYDMHGNVWEWCEDVWHKNYKGAPKDGSAWVTKGKTNLRVLRGGSWFNNPEELRSASRSAGTPTLCLNNVGFRVVGVPSR